MPSYPTDPDCIFCKIVAGEIPCHKLYEDEHVFAFLDIGPLSRGHCLLIPKGHWETLDQVDDDAAAAMGAQLPKLARAVLTATGATAYNVLQNNGAAAGQAVGHVHFHIIPRYGDKGATDAGSGLPFTWPAGEIAPDDAVALKDAIVGALSVSG